MGNSAVSFRGRYFFASDSWIELWLFFLVRQLDKLAEPLDWMANDFTIRDWWDYQAHLGAPGLVSTHLDEYITTENRRGEILEVCQSAFEELLDFGDLIPAAWLNLHKLGGEHSYWTTDVSVYQ